VAQGLGEAENELIGIAGERGEGAADPNVLTQNEWVGNGVKGQDRIAGASGRREVLTQIPRAAASPV
jgi:hypothetical protein